MIHHGDCLDVMAGMDPASVDAIVTDPPYGLEFMGKEWDRLGAVAEHPDDGEGPWGRTALVRFGKSAVSAQEWHQRWATEAFRVAKPGAYLLAFGGTRTYHRMTCAIEDAGWIIRDCLVWAYASGFPKSRALLKPAWEPIVMARKPGPLRELAIDACRIPGAVPQTTQGRSSHIYGNGNGFAPDGLQESEPSSLGRWPANLILTDPIFDGDTPGVVGGGETAVATSWGPRVKPVSATGYDLPPMGTEPHVYGDSGTYSRFFLVPKADRAEREPVLPSLPKHQTTGFRGNLNNAVHEYSDGAHRDAANRPPRSNVHPTVKPLDLMRHLVRLVTPPGGTVLDPFLGSGTTGLAAEMEGFAWIGIEREAEYVAIAEARLNGTQRGLGLDVEAPTPQWKDYPTATRYPVKGPSQSSWFTPSTRDEESA